MHQHFQTENHLKIIFRINRGCFSATQKNPSISNCWKIKKEKTNLRKRKMPSAVDCLSISIGPRNSLLANRSKPEEVLPTTSQCSLFRDSRCLHDESLVNQTEQSHEIHHEARNASPLISLKQNIYSFEFKFTWPLSLWPFHPSCWWICLVVLKRVPGKIFTNWRPSCVYWPQK